MVHFIMLEGLRNTLIGFIFDNQSEAKITQSLDSDQLSKNGQNGVKNVLLKRCWIYTDCWQ